MQESAERLIMSENETSPEEESSKPNKNADEADAGTEKTPAKKAAPKKKQNPLDALDSLSSLDLGPAWARDKKSSPPKSAPKRKQAARKGGARRDDTDRRPRRDFKGKGAPRSGAGGGGAGGGRRNDRRSNKDDFRDKPKPVELPEGVTARIMPIEQGMDGVAKQISATGRTHSVFELAWFVIGNNDHFSMIFEKEKSDDAQDAPQPLIQCQSDHSLWQSQQECLNHFWQSKLVDQFYNEDIAEVDPPAGNFQSVARCGISGVLIGPPNHHAYQQSIIDLHRERFSNMPLDRYKQKIKMEHGEEAVQQWIDSMTKQVRWRPKTAEELAQKDKEDVKEEPKEEKAESNTAAPAETESADSPAEPPAPDKVESPEPIFTNRREVEQHFLAHFFDLAYKKGNKFTVPASIPTKLISPALLALLRHTVAEEKRYPGKLASFLCRQMSGRHLAVFKWKKRLHCGPARPKQVPDDLVMADRPQQLFQWVLKHPSASIDKMWKDLLPEDIDEKDRHAWYHDLHWLINEGLVLLFADGKLHAAKELNAKAEQPLAKKKAQKTEKKSAKESESNKKDSAGPDEKPPETSTEA